MVAVLNSGDPVTGTSDSEILFGNPATTGTASNTLNGNGGNDLIIGDIGAVNVLNAALHNGTLAAAYNLESDINTWTYDESSIIDNSTIVAHSTTVVNASDGEWEYFSVSVGAGQSLTADLDFGGSSVLGNLPDTYIEILDSAGNVVAGGDDTSPVDAGSFNFYDPQASYTSTAGGTYYIRVRPLSSGTYFTDGQAFLLNVSVTGHSTGISNSVGGDVINGGDGNDVVYGVAGNDVVAGGAGSDRLDGGSGDDTLNGGDGVDNLNGGSGDDVLNGGDGADRLTSGGGSNDILHGDGGNDILTVNSSGSFYGDAGDDTVNISASASSQSADGGDGVDTINLAGLGSGTVTVDLAAGTTSVPGLTFARFENATVGGGNDTVSGNTDNNVLSGGDGNDGLFGGAGSDTLIGGDGNDTLTGGTDAGHTDVDYASYAGVGSDVTVSLALTGAQNTIGAGTDTLTGIEGLIGGAGSDTLTGNDEANWFHGGGGTNTITAGGGNDTFLYGNDDSSDQDVLDGGAGDDTLDLSGTLLGWSINVLNPGSGARISNLNTGASIDSLTSVEHVIGSNAADVILTGGIGAGYSGISIDAGAGNDVVTVAFGGDVIDGGSGIDTIDLGLDTVDYPASLANGGSLVFFDSYSFDMASGVTSNVGESLTNFENIAFLDASAAILGGVAVTTDFIISGTTRANDIVLGAGDDVIDGRGGGDTMHGGEGDDTYVVYAQIDLVDEVSGEGYDTVKAAASYTLAAGVSVEALQTTSSSGTASIRLIGNDLAQTITGNAGANNIQGLGGNDTLIGGLGNDRLDGGNGTDTVSYATATTAVNVNLAATLAQDTGGGGKDTLFSIENAIGSNFADALAGSSGNNVLSGGDGNDALRGGLGNDTLDGGSGTDRVTYSDATAGVSVNLANSGAQNTGSAGTDMLISIESLTGSAYDDTLAGTSGSNVLQGSGGNDTLRGGAGNDTLDGGTGIDRASYSDASALVTVSLATSGAQNTGGGGTDTLTSIENVTGSNYNDVLTGSSSANILSGGSGNDTLDGGLGSDTLEGSTGADTFRFTTTLGSNNIDTVTGFTSGTDKFALAAAVFAGLTTGNLADAAFYTGSAAHDGDDRIIYNSATGALLFDRDGSGSTYAAVQFATLGTGLTVVAADFRVI